jgi:hypothetical protein
MIKEIKVNFDSDVVVDPNAFTLEVSTINGGGTFAPVAFTVNQATALVSGKTVATLTFSGGAGANQILGGSLIDGNYRITALSSAIRSTVGSVALDGDNNGSAGGNFVDGESATDNFFRLFGDSTGDGAVGAPDTNRYRQTVGRSSPDPLYFAALDFNSDNAVGAPDTNAYRQRVGKVRAF